ncbi:MAG TPA: SDR family NAD(P)-dependent oxidoreductase [Actinomycetales bacterium]|nr:SDR family NAD(P)-dependent oxidoreductase [Actinomycetales bacterium]
MTGRPYSRVALVTGGSSGIGLATALEFARVGDHLVLLARAREPLERAAEQCRAAGAGSVTAVAADVRDADAMARAVAQVYADHGRLDVAVLSAGVVAYGRFEEVPAEIFDAVLGTLVSGCANVARAVLPRMRADNHGTVVLIGSVIGTLGVPTMSPYVVGKWGIRALARELQLENRDRPGVHVTLVTPGGVDTPIYRQAANYAGRVGQPPPPVYSPERVARAIVRALDNPPHRLSVGAANPVMALGFALLPRLYDVLVGPLFAVAARGREPVSPTSGNVLTPVPEGEGLRGDAPAVADRLRQLGSGRR